jgi:hypothetical protein
LNHAVFPFLEGMPISLLELSSDDIVS